MKAGPLVKRRTSSGQPAAASRILVVGASGGIGCAVLKLLADAGAVLGAHYHHHREPLERFIAERGLPASQVKCYAADVRTQASCHALVDAFVEWAGGLDGLVQLCGDVSRPCRWEELIEEEWLADLNVNLSGPFFLVQRAMHHMRARGGRVVLTSTASARHGGGSTSIAYGVAKAGVECLTKACAREGAPHGILVNAVAPGFIETAFHRTRMRRGNDELARRAARVPLKRAGTPEEVARLVVYLLSPDAGYITGECISVSGGDWL